MEQKRWYYLGLPSLIGLIGYIFTAVLLIAILQYIFGRDIRMAGERLMQSVWPSLLAGLLFYVGIPLLITLLLITIIGVPIGLMLLAIYIFILILSMVIAALVLTYWLNKRTGSNWSYTGIMLSAFAIFLLLTIVTYTPFFGWLVAGFIIMVTSGAILRGIRYKRKPASTEPDH